MSRARRLLCSLGLAVLIAAGVITLTTDAAAVRPGGPPGPLCGFTTIWDCTLPNGSHVEVIGTQCDVAKFERRTGATCEPKSF